MRGDGRMETVYILAKSRRYAGETICGVYTNEDLAEDDMKTLLNALSKEELKDQDYFISNIKTNKIINT